MCWVRHRIVVCHSVANKWGLNFRSFTKLWLMAILCRWMPNSLSLVVSRRDNRHAVFLCLFHFRPTSTLITLSLCKTFKIHALWYVCSCNTVPFMDSAVACFWCCSFFVFFLCNNFCSFYSMFFFWFNIHTVNVMRNVVKWNGTVNRESTWMRTSFLNHCLSIHRENR